jgi:hypothetical protein
VGQRDEDRCGGHQGERRGGEQSETSLDHVEVYPGKLTEGVQAAGEEPALQSSRNRIVRIVAAAQRGGNFISPATTCLARHVQRGFMPRMTPVWWK